MQDRDSMPTSELDDLLPSESKVVVAVLNWGLGHATRMIPIIRKLIRKENEVIIASDGEAESLLMHTFPNLLFYTLPGYNIKYKYESLVKNIFTQFSKGYSTKKEEHLVLKKLLDEHRDVSMIISDNRFGCYSKRIKSIFITHQLKPFHSLKLMRWIFGGFMKTMLRPYDEIWIPDHGTKAQRLSGELSDEKGIHKPQKYIGPLSRFANSNMKALVENQNLLVILSGPEPQRTILEEKLIPFLKLHSEKNIILIRGKIDDTRQLEGMGRIKVFNFLSGQKLEQALIHADTIICRSGYSTLMDLEALHKTAILIPTPGQTEQEYLADYLHKSRAWQVVQQNNLSKIAL